MGVHLGVWGFIPSHSFALMGQNITKIRIFLLEILVKKDPLLTSLKKILSHFGQVITKIRIFYLEILVKKDPLLTSLKKILSHFGQVILNLYILIVPCSFLPTLS
jgi:hypothetical protein